MSQTPLLAPADTFVENQGIDITSRPGSLRLSAASATYLTADDDILMLDVDSLGNIISGLDNGKIYQGTSLKYTASADPFSITSLTLPSGTTYNYIFKASAIDRTTTDFTTVNVDYKTYAQNSAVYRPVYNDEGARIIFGAGNRVYQMDRNEVVQELLSLALEQDVVKIFKFNDQFRIYTRDRSTGVNGKLYIWDGVSTRPNYVSDLYGAAPIAGVNFANTDFVVAGYNQYYSDVYQFSGLQYQSIFSQLDGAKARVIAFGSEMLIDRGVVFGTCKLSNGYSAIYRIGSEFVGYKNPIALEYVTPNTITKIIKKNAVIYVGESGAGSTYFVKSLAIPAIENTYVTSGYIVSNLFSGGDLLQKKKITGIKFQASGIGTVAIKIDRACGREAPTDYVWSTISTATINSVVGDKREFYVPATALAALENIFGWSLRVDLTGSGTSTPEVHGVEVIFEDGLGD